MTNLANLNCFEKNEYVSETFIDVEFAAMKLSLKEFEDCTFIDCDFNETVFNTCKFIDCCFEKCNLSVLQIDNSKFSDVAFKGCKMIGVDWTKAQWPLLALSSPVSFEKSNISDSSFFGLLLEKIEMLGCEAHDVDFREGTFSGGNFSETDFLNSLFHNTNLTGANFTDSTRYSIDVYSNKIRNASFSRFEALVLLEGLGINLVD